MHAEPIIETEAKKKRERSRLGRIAAVLAETPPEFQAAVYAKLDKQQQAKRQIDAKLELVKLKQDLEALKKVHKIELRDDRRIAVADKIRHTQRLISKASKRVKKSWSPVVSGSFESGSKR